MQATRFYFLGFFVLTLFPCGSQHASAQSKWKFYCDAKQETCEIETKELTVGDQVIFYDSQKRLLARGKVVKLNLGRRVVEITKKWGPISKNSTVDFVNFDMKESYQVYKHGTERNIGLGFGIASYDVGTDVTGFEGTGYYEQKVFKDLKAHGRGHLWTGSGVVHRAAQDGTSGTEDGNVKFTGLGGSGGIAYTLFDGQNLSFRGELGAGFMYLSADVDGDKDDVEKGGYHTHIKHGIGLLGRIDVSASYAFDFATLAIYISQNYFHEATGSIFGLAYIHNLK